MARLRRNLPRSFAPFCMFSDSACSATDSRLAQLKSQCVSFLSTSFLNCSSERSTRCPDRSWSSAYRDAPGQTHAVANPAPLQVASPPRDRVHGLCTLSQRYSGSPLRLAAHFRTCPGCVVPHGPAPCAPSGPVGLGARPRLFGGAGLCQQIILQEIADRPSYDPRRHLSGLCQGSKYMGRH